MKNLIKKNIPKSLLIFIQNLLLFWRLLNYKKPLFTWTPSIAISQGAEYDKNYFEKFKNNLIVGSLGGMSLFRLYLSEDFKIINEERIVIDERVRDLAISNNGKIIVYTDSGNLLELSKVEYNN